MENGIVISNMVSLGVSSRWCKENGNSSDHICVCTFSDKLVMFDFLLSPEINRYF